MPAYQPYHRPPESNTSLKQIAHLLASLHERDPIANPTQRSSVAWGEPSNEGWIAAMRFSATTTPRLAALIFAFKEVIALNPKAPPAHHGIEHRIPFDPSLAVRPFKSRLRRLSPAERAAEQSETQQLLDNGLIRYSHSPSLPALN